eukprot:TRINITY_DN3437_c0_g2_i3.p1 TRINITY_DN3437_c0_g2~~TRINITY_DN3437_c0_g2_i3.p1  ORF type:complete len:191 (+),score=50.85 TRINITY_DN3437_c0_g2_i3:34-606(+)
MKVRILLVLAVIFLANCAVHSLESEDILPTTTNIETAGTTTSDTLTSTASDLTTSFDMTFTSSSSSSSSSSSASSSNSTSDVLSSTSSSSSGPMPSEDGEGGESRLNIAGLHSQVTAHSVAGITIGGKTSASGRSPYEHPQPIGTEEVGNSILAMTLFFVSGIAAVVLVVYVYWRKQQGRHMRDYTVMNA